MNIYKKFKTYLIEMSDSISHIRQNIQNHLDQIINNLLKCYLIQNETDNLNHWKQETYSQLSSVPKINRTNKYPSKKQLRKWIITYIEDVLDDRIVREIDNINYTEKNYYINRYDVEILHVYIIEYLDWLCLMLSDKGQVTTRQVHSKIDELIGKYK